MNHTTQFFIGGSWVDPHGSRTLDVVDPATETIVETIALGDAADVDAAVAAARAAFATFSRTTREERLALLDAILAHYDERSEDLARAVSLEMGAPLSVARGGHVWLGHAHLQAARTALADFAFEESIGSTGVVLEPIGVCGLITPWNWPLNQIGAKVAPALAVGATMVLKPSEIAPLSALVFAEILQEAGVPDGVFNLVNGDGPGVGTALAAHPDVDMISFTGSTRAGIEVARNAAPTVKRVTQELGGKSANIVLDDADLAAVIRREVAGMCVNSGQSCNALARILIPRDQLADAVEIARDTIEALVVGDPADPTTDVGPVASQAQFDKVQRLIASGIEEGATVVAGGVGRPDGLDKGYYVQPTVFADVTPQMTIAREEIFGPVMTLQAYGDIDEAVAIANDSEYGLAGGVSSASHERALAVARRMRTGMVHLNGTGLDPDAPFGGYKQSGNGREFGGHGFREYLEIKSIFGANV